jgi:D-inositol-3-phosphate glycosyltransferase
MATRGRRGCGGYGPRWAGRPGPGLPRRMALLSMHTSPLHQPGAGDAGGLNVYVVEVAKQLAAAGVGVDIFTRATGRTDPPAVRLVPGVTVRHVAAGPYEGLAKQDLPGQLCAFTAGVLRAEAARPAGAYDLVHSHYWLSGAAGYPVARRWGVPLVHTAHTLGRVKNAQLAAGDAAEPAERLAGEDQLVAGADRLVANTGTEADELVEYYAADPDRISVVSPGVDLTRFTPGDSAAVRQRHGIPADALVVLFVGRIQPLKAPDLLLRAVAELRRRDPRLADRVVPVVVGSRSGAGLDLPALAGHLGVPGVRFLPAQPADRLAGLYRAADLVCMPSHNESFGLVALEAQSCGTPVVAAAVGGLTTAVRDGVTGTLVGDHSTASWAAALGALLSAPRLRDRMSAAAVEHAARFSWSRTVDGLLAVYRDAIREYADRPLTA